LWQRGHQGWAVVGSATDFLHNPKLPPPPSPGVTLRTRRWMELFAKYASSYASCSNPSEDKTLPAVTKY